MKTTFFFKFLCLLLLTNTSWALEFKGIAYALKSGELLYTEFHKTIPGDDGLMKLIETEYKNTQGEVIAKIRSDFSKDNFIPDVVFEDLRNQTKETQVLNKEKQSVTIQKLDIKKMQTKERTFPIKKNMLGGQGFNNFLVANFADLLGGKSIHINFIVLANRDYFQFDIKRKHPPENGQIDLGLNVSNYFLKMFVKEIKTRYDIKTKRLLTFKGLSNLLDAEGAPLKVRIEYEYASK